MMEAIRQLLYDGVSQRLTILEQEQALSPHDVEGSEYLQVIEFLRTLYTQVRLWRYESIESFQQFWDEELRHDAILDLLAPLTAQLRVYGFAGWGAEQGEWQKLIRTLSHSFTSFEGSSVNYRIMDDDLADRLPQQEELSKIMGNNPLLVTVFLLYTMPEIYTDVVERMVRLLNPAGGKK